MIVVLIHPDSTAAECDAFALEAQPLFHARVAGKPYFTPCAHHTVPRNRPVSRAQRPRHLPGAARVPGGTRHLTISRDLALRDFPNRLDEFPKHALLGDRRRFPDVVAN
jgi:hypothetical protein